MANHQNNAVLREADQQHGFSRNITAAMQHQSITSLLEGSLRQRAALSWFAALECIGFGRGSFKAASVLAGNHMRITHIPEAQRAKVEAGFNIARRAMFGAVYGPVGELAAV